MFGIGTGELLLLLVLALLVLGPERMPKLARDIGKTVADLRKTSDELRTEFLNADQMLKQPERLLDVAAKRADAAAASTVPPVGTEKEAEAGATASTAEAPVSPTQETVPPDAGATQAEVTTGIPPAGPSGRTEGSEAPPIPAEPEETAFDREARLARERLEDPEAMKEHMERAKAEGWTVPTDEAGTSAREG
jgi:sec-independent protein translocase protein TatB